MKICQKDKKKSKCIPKSGVRSFHKWTTWKDCFIQFLASTLLIYDLSFLILLFCSKPIEPDRLFDCLPKSLRPSSSGEENINNSKHENQAKSLEAAVYKPPALIPPRVLPLLHDLAQQLVQAGHQQQCFKIYRLEQAKHDSYPTFIWQLPNQVLVSKFADVWYMIMGLEIRIKPTTTQIWKVPLENLIIGLKSSWSFWLKLH